MTVVSKHNPLDHYQWGEQCDGWVLANEKELSVKLERMPAHTEEQKHFHRNSRQFFFMLSGTAVFEIDAKFVVVNANEGILIQPGQQHRIMNQSDAELEFLLSSQPAVMNDRINC